MNNFIVSKKTARLIVLQRIELISSSLKKIRKIFGREWKGGRPPDMCHQLQRLFVQCPFIRVGAKWVRARSGPADRTGRAGGRRDGSRDRTCGCEHVQRRRRRRRRRHEGEGLQDRVEPRGAPEVTAQTRGFTCTCSKIGVVPLRSRFRSRSRDRALDRAPDRRASFP